MTSTWTHPWIWIYTLLVSASEPVSWLEWPQCVENIQQDVLDEPWSSGTHKALCFPRTTWCDEDRLNWRRLDGEGCDLKQADWTFLRIIKVWSLSHPSWKAPIWIGFLSWWEYDRSNQHPWGWSNIQVQELSEFFFFYKKDQMNINNIYYVDCVCLRKVPPVFHSRRQEAVDVSSLQSGSVCRFFPVCLSANHFHAFLHFLRYKAIEFFFF